jgi:hypothetical protein
MENQVECRIKVATLVVAMFLPISRATKKIETSICLLEHTDLFF